MLLRPPLFSVVVPVFNRADLVVNAINSIFEQSMQDFEVIVVDDGSTDDISAVISGIADSRIRFFRQANAGASSARNSGIDLAIGRYVAFLDSDDLFLPNHLASVQLVLDGTDDMAAYSPVIVRRGVDKYFVKPWRAIRANENMATYLICDRGFVQTSGLALQTEVARKVRYNINALFGDDTDFAIRLQLAGCRFEMTECPTVIWSDDVDHDRLSTGRKPIGDIGWLDELRSHIPDRAYYGYLGWHVAKSFAQISSSKSFKLYFSAVCRGAYPPRLAVIIFLQIFLPDRYYRRLTQTWIFLSKFWRRGFETS